MLKYCRKAFDTEISQNNPNHFQRNYNDLKITVASHLSL